MIKIITGILGAGMMFSVLAAPPLPLPPSTLPPLVAPGAPSQPPASDFQTFGTGIPLSEFLRITLRGIAGRAYVLTPDASQSSAPISADLAHVHLSDPLPLVRAVLDNLGLTMRDVDGVLFIEKAKSIEKAKEKAAKKDLFLYAPHYRSVSSLSTYFAMFPDILFSYSSGANSVRLPAPSVVSSVAVTAAPSEPVAQPLASSAAAAGIADRDPSMLVARGTPDDLAHLSEFLAKVDIAVPEVLLRAYVIEVSNTNFDDSGVQIVADILGIKGIGVNVGSAVPGDSIRIGPTNLSVSLGSLRSDSRVHLMSSPVLRAVDGSTSSVSIGTDTPTLGAISYSQSGGTQQSVVYQSAGVLLSVSPKILSDSIRLAISQELSSFVSTTTGIAASPTKLRRSISSDVIAHVGETILLGGLKNTQTTTAHAGNFLFKTSKNVDTSDSDIVVVIQVERI